MARFEIQIDHSTLKELLGGTDEAMVRLRSGIVKDFTETYLRDLVATPAMNEHVGRVLGISLVV